MSEPTINAWENPEDDGVLDDADTLASDDMRKDRLDAGIEPPDADPAAHLCGTTEAEARHGETLDQRLAEEEPDPTTTSPAATRPAAANPDREAGQLIVDTATVDTATELPAAVPDAVHSAEEAAIHVHQARP